ncbi:MAG: 2-oxo-4-hydroxy-4-carboxy-5-ureidoimidazoline decarboxylase [Burkholderiales bacterium]
MGAAATAVRSFADVNAMPAAEFVALLGGIFEHSPWVAEGVVNDRPFTSVDALHTAMVAVVEQAGRDRRLALLNAHPELAGQEAQQGQLTPSSTTEQARAGLHALSAGDVRRITALNLAYRARFGFPFIIAVRDHTKDGVFEAFSRRLANEADAEFAEALWQVYRISRLRLDALLAAD